MYLLGHQELFKCEIGVQAPVGLWVPFTSGIIVWQFNSIIYEEITRTTVGCVYSEILINLINEAINKRSPLIDERTETQEENSLAKFNFTPLSSNSKSAMFLGTGIFLIQSQN